MMKRTSWLLGLVVVWVLAAAAGDAVAKKNGGGGPGGDGSASPPADPVIAYVDLAGSGDPLLVMNADGSNKTVLVGNDAAEPSWGPGGEQIVFRSGWSLTTSRLTVVNVDGTGATDIFDGSTFAGKMATKPAWSPTDTPFGGEQIAFTMAGDIYLISPAGGEPVNLTNSPTVAEDYATWSPDADRLAFRCLDVVTGDETIEVLYLAAFVDWDPETAPRPQAVVASASAESYVDHFVQLDWACTQDRILYAKRRSDLTVKENNSDVWYVDFGNLDGIVHKQVTTTTDASEGKPRWSPDDQQVLLNRTPSKGGDAGLYVVDLDGDIVRSLGAKSGTWAAWLR